MTVFRGITFLAGGPASEGCRSASWGSSAFPFHWSKNWVGPRHPSPRPLPAFAKIHEALMFNSVPIWPTLLFVLAFDLPAEAQLKKKPQNVIPPNVAKAWTDAGATMGWMYDDDGIPLLAHGDVT